jgi:acetyl-CoA/propionyl-CoA carboxylase biotin carboxyl carrier protein
MRPLTVDRGPQSDGTSPRRLISKLFVANRGEIALRIVRAARDYGIRSIVPHTHNERDTPAVHMADEGLDLGPGGPRETFLSLERMVRAALESGADAVHPGYGFLSEAAEFAEAIEQAGLLWVGPSPAAIRLLSDKVAAKQIATRVGAPVLGGPDHPLASTGELHEVLNTLGLPLVLKAAFGGGGRGMRVIRERKEADALFDAARRESIAAFGRDEIFVERFLEQPRHIEVQVLGDAYGTVVAVGTRDCTLQRRFQKVIEEAPAPFLPEGTETIVNESARAICAEAHYTSAGTVEFLVGRDGSTAFLEVNTRLQVEHPVTEATTGIDLVVAQLRIAEGEPLWLNHNDLSPIGHAIEFRINAEDPSAGFTPSAGRLERLRLPSGPGVRIDAGLEEGGVVDLDFDSLIAKVIVVGADRDETLRRARRALQECEVSGVATLLPLHLEILSHEEFLNASSGILAIHNTWIESELLAKGAAGPSLTSSGGAYVRIGGREVPVELPLGLNLHELSRRTDRSSPTAETERTIRSPMQGTVTSLHIVNGATVQQGDPICGIEAMKMENLLLAPESGVISGLSVSLGTSVRRNSIICTIDSTETLDRSILRLDVTK